MAAGTSLNFYIFNLEGSIPGVFNNENGNISKVINFKNEIYYSSYIDSRIKIMDQKSFQVQKELSFHMDGINDFICLKEKGICSVSNNLLIEEGDKVLLLSVFDTKCNSLLQLDDEKILTPFSKELIIWEKLDNSFKI